MLKDIRKNPDEELIDGFLQSPGPKEWRIWKKKSSKELPLEASVYSALIQKFPGIPEREVDGLELFERNNTSLVNRIMVSLSLVSLPALELSFQDPEHPGTTYIGFVEGRENLNNFLKGFIQKYDERYPPEGIPERSIRSIKEEK